MVVSKELVDLLQATVTDCHLAFKGERGGKPADYIPALAQVDPELFGISVCTVDGDIFTAGDCGARFSIQSVSKPFLYAQALSRLGENRVLEKVGVEPTGYSFNSIVRLEGGSNRADNPMVNAGAIAISGLLTDQGRKLDVKSIFEPFLDRQDISIDNEIFSSEVSTGNRNYSIANLLKYHKILDGSVDDALDLYFQSCSTLVDARDLSIMAAVFANSGVNPITGSRAVLEKHNARILAVMSTCGLYDYSGEFIFFTGLPAKSGVSGALIAVVPGVMGISLYSPRIDSKGNSIRGIAALPYLSEKLSLHVFHPKTNLESTADSVILPAREDLEELLAKFENKEIDCEPSYLDKLEEPGEKSMAVSIFSVDGKSVSCGDTTQSFSIQAAINPVVFGYALEEKGLGRVLDHVGVEPSGNPYNAIFFKPETNIPFNPLGNGGAIAVDSLLPGSSTEKRFAPLLSKIQALCMNESINVDPAVLELEQENANRNKAIAYLLRQFNVIQDIERPLGIYFRQCSIRFNCDQVARMAAVLANGGSCPVTGQRHFGQETVQRILSVMYTCGLYDYSGRFAYDVGIPAKSGISGIIFGVLPGRFGIAVYAPGVDAHGNSIRGMRFLKHFSRLFKLSVFDPQVV